MYKLKRASLRLHILHFGKKIVQPIPSCTQKYGTILYNDRPGLRRRNCEPSGKENIKFPRGTYAQKYDMSSTNRSVMYKRAILMP